MQRSPSFSRSSSSTMITILPARMSSMRGLDRGDRARDVVGGSRPRGAWAGCSSSAVQPLPYGDRAAVPAGARNPTGRGSVPAYQPATLVSNSTRGSHAAVGDCRASVAVNRRSCATHPSGSRARRAPNFLTEAVALVRCFGTGDAAVRERSRSRPLLGSRRREGGNVAPRLLDLLRGFTSGRSRLLNCTTFGICAKSIPFDLRLASMSRQE